jgi:putative SOS response-associated peptidase YedK
MPVEGGKGPSAMPLILNAKNYSDWLQADWKEAQKLVQPFPAVMMAAVSDSSFG